MSFNLAFVIQELKSRLTVNNDWRSNRGRHPKNHSLVLSSTLYAVVFYLPLSNNHERFQWTLSG